MTETITIELTHVKALQLLQDLEAMNIIRLCKNEPAKAQQLSQKYRGILTKEEGKNLNEHIQNMRSEWNNSL